MADLLCAECAKPILSTDSTSTIEQVDTCTAAVERVTYDSTCWDGMTGGKAPPPAG